MFVPWIRKFESRELNSAPPLHRVMHSRVHSNPWCASGRAMKQRQKDLSFHESTRILRFVGKGHELIEIEISKSSSWKRACRHLMLFTHLDKSGRYSRQASELICWFSLIGKFRERRRGCKEGIRGTRVEFIRACGSTCWILVIVAERLRVYVRSVHTRKCLARSHSSAAC